MSLQGWLKQSINRVQEDGVWGVLRSVYILYLGIWLTFSTRMPVDENIYEEEWDALIILDACRVDALREVAGEYEFINTVDTVRSTGSTSSEWIAKTFDTNRFGDKIEETTYITGNPFSDQVLRQRDFPPDTETPFCYPKWNTALDTDLKHLEEVWRYGRSDDLSTVPPRAITDKAIEISRKNRENQLLIHYMQPHSPFLTDGLSGRNLEDLKSDTEVSQEAIWNAYKETLRNVLNDVELLLDNIDADSVVITADHGEAFGEWGAYGHPIGFPHPKVKRVPWIRTTAKDKGTHTPSVQEDTVDSDVTEHLADLGYV